MDSRVQPEVVCIGEVLWDVFPDDRRLGGAPFNVACHLSALGVHAAMISRIGDDAAGRDILQQVRERGLVEELVQVDPHLPTGEVLVTLTGSGSPRYVICEPAAWDAIRATTQAHEATRSATAVVYGSLAQRREPARSAIRRLLETSAVKVFDVNLRPPHDDRVIVEHLLHRSDMVKLNDEEMERLAAWYGLDGADSRQQCERTASRFGLQTVCLTRGAAGAALWHRGSWSEVAGHSVSVADTVGAGDAFLAGLLFRMLRGVDPDRALAFANALGAYVASQPGAIPTLDMTRIHAMIESEEPA